MKYLFSIVIALALCSVASACPQEFRQFSRVYHYEAPVVERVVVREYVPQRVVVREEVAYESAPARAVRKEKVVVREKAQRDRLVERVRKSLNRGRSVEKVKVVERVNDSY